MICSGGRRIHTFSSLLQSSRNLYLSPSYLRRSLPCTPEAKRFSASHFTTTSKATATTNNKMVCVEYIRYKVPVERRDEFVQAYVKGSEQLNASKHCDAYELTECDEEKGTFILRIEWKSADEHMQGFRKSDVFPQFFANVKPFFNEIQEMRHYSIVPQVNHRK